MEMQISKSRENMQNKIPEIEKAIEIVDFLKQEHSNISFIVLIWPTYSSIAEDLKMD